MRCTSALGLATTQTTTVFGNDYFCENHLVELIAVVTWHFSYDETRATSIIALYRAMIGHPNHCYVVDDGNPLTMSA